MISTTIAPQLILASASPRRQQLLREAGVTFTTIPSTTDEQVRPGETADTYVCRVAEEKAQNVARRYPGSWILGADTIVAIDGEVLGKPRNEADGQRMLRLLSGRTHRVMTAFVLLDEGGHLYTSQLVTSTVTFRALSDSQIREYLATGEPFDKAGAYAVQGLGAALVAGVEGSYTNVVGLPRDEVLAVLQSAGLLEKSHISS